MKSQREHKGCDDLTKLNSQICLYNWTLFFIQSQSAQQVAYGLGLRGHRLSSTN